MDKTPLSSQKNKSWSQEKEALLARLKLAEETLSVKEDELRAKDNIIFLNAESLRQKDDDLCSKDTVISLKEEKIQALSDQIILLEDYLRQEKQHRFGRKSEKHLINEMPLLPTLDRIFDEDDEEVPEETLPLKEKKKNTGGGRKPIPQDLPREAIIYDLGHDNRVCECGHALHKIGEESTEQLEVIPAKIKVLRHIRHKYACKGCEETVLLAPMPKQPIPHSIAGPGLLSHVMVSKYADHLPLYRQAGIWQRAGVDLDRSTLGRWMTKCGQLFSPIIKEMKEDIINSGYIQADETPLQVLSEKGRLSTSKSYMWVYKTGGEEKAKVVYDYSATRDASTAKAFLEGFIGYLQSDAYSGYKKVIRESKGIKPVGCMAHARRKFADIVKSHKKAPLSTIALEKIAKLYAIEKEAKKKNLTAKEIKALRQEKSKPLMEDLKQWLEDKKVKAPPKSSFGKAIAYSLNNWTELSGYLEEGYIEIDNNAAERCIKPFVIGRKNWLFVGNEKSAKAGANIYSLIETCKAHGVNPFEYLTDILQKIHPLTEIKDEKIKKEKFRELLPYHWKPPEING